MKVIELTKGQVAIVDDEDFERLAQWRWHLSSNGYAIRMKYKGDGKHGRFQINMHQEILGKAPKGMMLDHANGIRTDNRRCNLRFATIAQNNANSKVQRTSILGIKGVNKVISRKGRVRYRAQITVNDKNRHIGLFETPEEAHAAYCAAATAAWGEFARFN